MVVVLVVGGRGGQGNMKHLPRKKETLCLGNWEGKNYEIKIVIHL